MPICECLGNVWEGVPKAARGNRKLRCGLKNSQHRVEGAAEEQRSTAAGTGGVCPQAPGCASSCPPKFPPSQVLLGVRNPLIHTAILGNVCLGHQSCTFSSPAISLHLIPAITPVVALLFRYPVMSPSAQGAQHPD